MNPLMALLVSACGLFGLLSLFLLWVLADANRLIARLDAANHTLQENNKHLLKVNLELSNAVVAARTKGN